MKGKIFNAQEVQAIIAGNKTMFREVIKPQPNSNINPVKLDYLCWQWATKESRRECPYQVRQKIFVKEKFARSFDNEGNPIAILEADSKQERNWEQARSMPQWASRLTLEITDIKVERLAEISEEDCKKEGFKTDYKILPHGIFKKDASKFFTENWNATHKKPKEKFEANPFVWVVDFKIIN